MCANGITNLARLRAPGLANRLYDDVRWRESAGLFGKGTAERFHEPIVCFLAAELG
jgi:hypothetical protein